MNNFHGDNPKAVAKFVRSNIFQHGQFTLSTVDADGNPWTTCLNLCFDHQFNVMWKSRTDTEHSQNIKKHPQISLCVFSVRHEVGDFGFYAKGTAREVTDVEELRHLLEIRYTNQGRPTPSINSFLGDSASRMYIAEITQAWVNDDRHLKTEVDLAALRAN